MALHAGFLAFMDLLSGDLQLDFDDARRPRIYASEVEVDEEKIHSSRRYTRRRLCGDFLNRPSMVGKNFAHSVCLSQRPYSSTCCGSVERPGCIRVAPGYFRYSMDMIQISPHGDATAAAVILMTPEPLSA